MKLGVVTGMSNEADCFSRALPGTRVLCSGARPEQARAAARQLLDEGCIGLLSFGLAGGLDPAVRPGDVILAESVVTPDGRRLDTDQRWRRRVVGRAARGGFGVSLAPVAASDYPLILPSEKAALFAATGAASVDMESHAVGQVAFDAGLPFLVLRAVLDPATRTLPSWIMETVGTDGRLDVVKAAIEAMCHPWDIPVLALLGWESGKALKSLGQVIALGGAGLGLD